MSTNVFANMMEVSGKASGNKSVAAMPDVCLSPPSPPAGPVPIPYPNTGMASDTTAGSKKVKIGGKEVGLKNKSKYKKSNGNQPATNSFGAGVVSHKLTGSVYFSAWSFDVKVEGSNVTRFGDLTTGNHMNSPATGNAALTASLATAQAAIADENECAGLQKANEEARDGMKTAGHKRNPETAHKGLQSVGNSGATVTHGILKSSAGVSGVVRAASNILVEKYDKTFSPYPGKKSGPSNMNGQGDCGPHDYRENPALPDTCHTEARILEEIFKAGAGVGGKLLLAIDWPGGPKKGLRTCDPCEHCNKLVCAAAKERCMEIEICNDEDPPEKEPACKD